MSSLIKMKATGNSMAPFLLEGDTVSIKPTLFSKLSVDDIISFFNRGQLITHRIVYTNYHNSRPFIITKGDFNFKDDGKVYPNQLVGKVIQVHRRNTIFPINQLYDFNAHYYLQEIDLFISLLEEENIEYIILKGLPLYLYLNKATPKRIFADCDFLVKKSNFNLVYKLLVKKGYAPENRITDFTKRIPELSFSKVINHFKVSFDIHTEPCFMMTKLSSLDMLYPSSQIDRITSEFFLKKERKQINKKQYYFLSQEHLLVYLFLHLFHHNFRGYNRYHLIHQLIERGNIKLIEAKNFTQKFNLSNFISPGLFLYRSYYPLKKAQYSFFNTQKPQKNKKINIFEETWKLEDSVERFIQLFKLSPFPLGQKLLVIFSREVQLAVIQVLYRKMTIVLLSSSFRLKNLTRKYSHLLLRS